MGGVWQFKGKKEWLGFLGHSWIQQVKLCQEGSPSLSLSPSISVLYSTRDQFHGRQFFHGWGGRWFWNGSSALHPLYFIIIITSAPPQIIRHQIPEAGDPRFKHLKFCLLSQCVSKRKKKLKESRMVRKLGYIRHPSEDVYLLFNEIQNSQVRARREVRGQWLVKYIDINIF